MRAPDDLPGRRRERRERRDARVRDAIARFLRSEPGWHAAEEILTRAPFPPRTHPAALWPALRELVDQGRAVVTMLELVEPCFGFAFRRTVPIFAHWSRAAEGVSRG